MIVLKNVLKIFFYCLISIFFIFIININVKGAASDCYLIMSNPSEDANSSVTITWHTLEEGTFVEYTKKEDTNFSTSTKVDGVYESLTVYDGTTSSNITDYKCYAVLNNLEKDCEYIYRVGKTNMSETYEFKTGGEEDFNFAVVSDIHVYSKLATRLTKATNIINSFNNKNKLSFVLTTGDIMAYGSNRGYWNDLCESDIIKDQLFVSTPGNHDYYNPQADFIDASFFNAYTKYPDNGPEGMKNTTYYFYYNNILFISLNSEDACTNASKKILQQEWLEEVLENNTADFIIAYFHRSMYPGSGGNTGHATTMKTAYQHLFDKYGVDLVFGGHDHVYVRTAKIYNGKLSEAPSVGTTYISLPQIGDRVNKSNDLFTVEVKKIGNISGGMVFNATKTRLYFSLYDDAGTLLDSGSIASKTASIETKKLERETNISYQDEFANMKLNIYSGSFQRVTNVKVYDDKEIVLDFRPEYEKTTYEIPNVSNNDLVKNYKIVITFRDGQIYEKEVTVSNKDLKLELHCDDITTNVNEEIKLNITNNLNMDLDYQYEYDKEFIKEENGKLIALKEGTTKINVLVKEPNQKIEVLVTIKKGCINVVYNLDGGSLSEQKDSFNIDEVVILNEPTKEGYTFKGWFLDKEFTKEFVSTSYTEDITLYAKWEPITNKGCNKSVSVLYTSLMLLGVLLLRKKFK